MSDIECGSYNCWAEGTSFCGRREGDAARVCRCKNGFTGDECRETDPSNIRCGSYNCWTEGTSFCGRTEGDAKRVCRCKNGYTGDECRDLDSANIRCGDYVCWAENTEFCGRREGDAARVCRCKEGWGGDECRDKIEPQPSPDPEPDLCAEYNKNDICNESKGYGKCEVVDINGIQTAKCICDQERCIYGDFCDDLCWLQAPNGECVPNDCNNRGTCSKETGKCTCDSGFTGDYCESSICQLAPGGRWAIGCNDSPGWLRRTGVSSNPYQYQLGSGNFSCEDDECICQNGGAEGNRGKGRKWRKGETGYAAPQTDYPYGGIATKRLSDGTCTPCPPYPPPGSPRGLKGSHYYYDNDPDSPHSGQQYCKACPYGTTNGEDSPYCNKCLPGFWGGGIPEELPNSEFHKNYHTARTDCARCPTGSTRADGPRYPGAQDNTSKTCNKCSPGYYLGNVHYDGYAKRPTCSKTCKDFAGSDYEREYTSCGDFMYNDSGTNCDKCSYEDKEKIRAWCISTNNKTGSLEPKIIPKTEPGGTIDTKTGELDPGQVATCSKCSCPGTTIDDTHSGGGNNVMLKKTNNCTYDPTQEFKNGGIYDWLIYNDIPSDRTKGLDESIRDECLVNKWCDSGQSAFNYECDWKYKYAGKKGTTPLYSNKVSEVTSTWYTSDLAPCPNGYHQAGHYSGVGFNKRICVLDGY